MSKNKGLYLTKETEAAILAAILKDPAILGNMGALEKLLMPNERAAADSQARVIQELKAARQRRGLSQNQLAELSGVKQPVIARIEALQVNPQIGTLVKLLAPLGLTLSITPIKED